MQTPMMGGMAHVNVLIKRFYKRHTWLLCKAEAYLLQSKQAVKMGQKSFVLATLPDNPQKIPLTGRVIWITHKQTHLKPQGFAIQLAGERVIIIKTKLKEFWRVQKVLTVQVIPCNKR